MFCKNCKKSHKPAKTSYGIYCSNACQHEFQLNLRLVNWINGAPIKLGPVRLKNLAIALYGYKCSCCGISEWQGKSLTLELDHINGDPYNNSPYNVRLLCPNCHSQTSTYKGKNKGNGRASRKGSK